MLKNGTQSAHEIQRMKVQLHSQFGVWHDVAQTIELKITPQVGGAKIKVWSVRDLSAIQTIATFCGLDSMPKRTNWQGFDLITHLEKRGDDFVNGIVNMPNNRRRNLADFKIVDGQLAYLNFFYYETAKSSMQSHSGSLVLQKNISASQYLTIP